MFMKSTVETQWLDMVHKAKGKPNYGMRDLDSVLEERSQNKLELVGPMVDSYLSILGCPYFVRMNGTNCLKKRVYKRVLENGKFTSQLNGRAAVMVSKKSPIICTFNKKQEIVCVEFYVQRYDVNDLAMDLSLQKLIS